MAFTIKFVAGSGRSLLWKYFTVSEYLGHVTVGAAFCHSSMQVKIVMEKNKCY